MPNKKSAKKRVKQNLRDEVRNKSAKADLKTRIKNTVAAIESKSDAADSQVRDTQALAGRLWKRGVIHKNKAARLQSRMMKKSIRAKAQNA